MDLGDIDLTDLSLFDDGPPHDAFRVLRDEAPVHWHEPTGHTPGGEGFWCLTRHEDVSWAARDGELFSSCTGGGRDGGGTPSWRRDERGVVHLVVPDAGGPCTVRFRVYATPTGQ